MSSVKKRKFSRRNSRIGKHEDLDSGTPFKMKFMLSQGMVPLWIQVMVFGQAASIYSLVYRCDIAILGMSLLLIAVLDMYMNPFVGSLQDREVLDSKGFPVKQWGRRASWFATHLPLCMILVAAMLLPPQSTSSDPGALIYIWFFVISLCGKWVHTVLVLAQYSAGDEIYPSQAERIQLYGLNVLMQVFAIILAVVGVQLIIGDADNSPDRCCAAEFKDNLAKTCVVTGNGTNTTYTVNDNLKADVSTSLIIVIIFTLLSLLGVLGVNPMKSAKQPTKQSAENAKEGAFSNLHEFTKWKPFVTLFMFWFFKVTNSSLTGMASFYMTYVLALDRDELATAFIAVAFIGLVVEVVVAGICSWFFGTKSKTSKTLSVNPRWYGIIGLITNALIQPVLVEIADGGFEVDGVTKKKGSVGLIILSFVLSRILNAPSNIWYPAARGWVVDADVQRTEGKRREAKINSFLGVATNIASIIAMILLSSLGPAGIDTSKCWGEVQDKGGVEYLKGIFQFAGSVLNLLTAIFLMMFPFHGDSLKELEDRQREFYVQNPDGSGEIVDAPPVGIGFSGGNKIVPVNDNL